MLPRTSRDVEGVDSAAVRRRCFQDKNEPPRQQGWDTGRFDTLAERAESGAFDQAAAEQARELYERDKLFPEIDYRVFAERR